jgi:hypothetical protein
MPFSTTTATLPEDVPAIGVGLTVLTGPAGAVIEIGIATQPVSPVPV